MKFSTLGVLIELIAIIIIAVGLLLTTDVAVYTGFILLLVSVFCFVYNSIDGDGLQ